jgi:hypothetical protein
MRDPGTEVAPLLVSSEGAGKQRPCQRRDMRRCFRHFQCLDSCSRKGRGGGYALGFDWQVWHTAVSILARDACSRWSRSRGSGMPGSVMLD